MSSRTFRFTTGRIYKTPAFPTAFIAGISDSRQMSCGVPDRRRMQCKDIPDLPILLFLEGLEGRWANWYQREYENSVLNAMPTAVQGKLALAKMRMLMRRGLVDGCDCGCRGDFVLTEKGREFIANQGKETPP